MPRLKDAYAEEVPVGMLIYPSKLVRRVGRDGNYYLDDIKGFAPNRDIFPALSLPSNSSLVVKILTPSGVHTISNFSVVSYMKPG